MKRSALVLAVFAAIGASFLAVAGAGLAAHPHKATASAAKKGTKPKRGPRGPRGHQGPTGPAWPKGETGATGRSGADGKAGTDGRDGKEGKEGKQGPSGVVEVANLDLSTSPAHNSGLAFIGETKTVTFGPRTVAVVTASLGFGSSDGKPILSHFGVCFKAPDRPIEVENIIQPEITPATGEQMVQTISDTLQALPSGPYLIGACSFNETANTVHGIGYASVLVAERAERAEAN